MGSLLPSNSGQCRRSTSTEPRRESRASARSRFNLAVRKAASRRPDSWPSSQALGDGTTGSEARASCPVGVLGQLLKYARVVRAQRLPEVARMSCDGRCVLAARVVACDERGAPAARAGDGRHRRRAPRVGVRQHGQHRDVLFAGAGRPPRAVGKLGSRLAERCGSWGLACVRVERARTVASPPPEGSVDPSSRPVGAERHFELRRGGAVVAVAGSSPVPGLRA